MHNQLYVKMFFIHMVMPFCKLQTALSFLFQPQYHSGRTDQSTSPLSILLTLIHVFIQERPAQINVKNLQEINEVKYFCLMVMDVTVIMCNAFKK